MEGNGVMGVWKKRFSHKSHMGRCAHRLSAVLVQGSENDSDELDDREPAALKKKFLALENCFFNSGITSLNES